MEPRPVDSRGDAPGSPAWMKVIGALFLMGWVGASVVWFVMSTMAVLMANDAGAAPDSAHAGMIMGVLGGQVLTLLSGIAGGLAFFWKSRRRMLWIAFVVLLAAGVFWQYQAFQSFVAAAAS